MKRVEKGVMDPLIAINLNLIVKEIPDFPLNVPMTEEGRVCAETQFEHYYRFSKLIDLAEFFGYPRYIADPVYLPGCLITRNDLVYNFIYLMLKRLNNILPPEATKHITNAMNWVSAEFEMIKFPEYNFKEEIEKVFDRYPNASNDIERYAKKMIFHLPQEWRWIFDWNLKIPPQFVTQKPWLRIINMGNPEGPIVFVEEVRHLIKRIQPKNKIECLYMRGTKRDYSQSFYYFPASYLQYAVGLYNINTCDFEVTEVTLEHSCPQVHHPIIGPAGGNIIPFVSAFFKQAKLYLEEKSPKRRNDMMTKYPAMFAVDGILPTFITYEIFFMSMMEKQMDSNFFKPMDKSRSKKLFQARLDELSSEPVIRKPRENLQVPWQAMEKLPKEIAHGAIQMMKIDAAFAQVLHENGYCEKGICYAQIFQSMAYGPCKLSDFQYKERIGLYLKKERFGDKDFNNFLLSHKEEISVPTPSTEENSIEKKKKRPSSESVVDSKSKDKQPDSSSQISPCSTPPSSEYTNACLLTKAKQEIESKTAEILELKLLASEQDLEIEQLKKVKKTFLTKDQESKRVNDSLRKEILRLKEELKTERTSAKNDHDKLTNDLKKMTVERESLENELVSVKTKCTLEEAEPKINDLEAKIEKMTRKSVDDSRKFNVLESETETLRNALYTSRSEVSELRRQHENLMSIIKSQEAENLEMSRKMRSDDCSQILTAIRQLQSQTNENFAKIHESESSTLEKDEQIEELTFLKNLYEKHSSPSVRAAVKRLKELQKLLDESHQQDERFGKNADDFMDEYGRLEFPKNKWRCKRAETYLKSARNEKMGYEAMISEMMERIKEAPHFSEPFSEETLSRVAFLKSLNNYKVPNYLNKTRMKGHKHLKEKKEKSKPASAEAVRMLLSEFYSPRQIDSMNIGAKKEYGMDAEIFGIFDEMQKRYSNSKRKILNFEVHKLADLYVSSQDIRGITGTVKLPDVTETYTNCFSKIEKIRMEIYETKMHPRLKPAPPIQALLDYILDEAIRKHRFHELVEFERDENNVLINMIATFVKETPKKDAKRADLPPDKEHFVLVMPNLWPIQAYVITVKVYETYPRLKPFFESKYGKTFICAFKEFLAIRFPNMQDKILNKVNAFTYEYFEFMDTLVHFTDKLSPECSGCYQPEVLPIHVRLNKPKKLLLRVFTGKLNGLVKSHFVFIDDIRWIIDRLASMNIVFPLGKPTPILREGPIPFIHRIALFRSPEITMSLLSKICPQADQLVELVSYSHTSLTLTHGLYLPIVSPFNTHCIPSFDAFKRIVMILIDEVQVGRRVPLTFHPLESLIKKMEELFCGDQLYKTMVDRTRVHEMLNEASDMRGKFNGKLTRPEGKLAKVTRESKDEMKIDAFVEYFEQFQEFVIRQSPSTIPDDSKNLVPSGEPDFNQIIQLAFYDKLE